MFRFNFSGEKEDANGLVNETSTVHKRQALLHHAEIRSYTKDEFIQVPIGPVTMAIVNQQHVHFQQRIGELSKLLTTSDIQTGVYEGGFKLWECAVDLIQYMIHHDSKFPLHAAGYKVMELGCGHGLPGASEVLFSDYNKEVIELATIPNVHQNASDIPKERSVFFSGDWELVSSSMQAQQGANCMEYDLILTAETLYTETVSISLLQMIKRHLKKQGGIALVAAKTYYFGTGGSVHHFKELIAQDGTMQATTVWESKDCKSNMREIVQVTYLQ